MVGEMFLALFNAESYFRQYFIICALSVLIYSAALIPLWKTACIKYFVSIVTLKYIHIFCKLKYV